ncbi:hypothetical protein [Haloarchaeobius sp. DFWS5]|uniref:hypothetical protein n=1 Tax=Haloarchaeobius sp. DFWS5 TaxID=3446114 RepID=UPI003EB8C4B0
MYSRLEEWGTSRVIAVVVTVLLVSSLVTVTQLDTVSTANAQVERDHATQVASEFTALHGSAYRVAGSGAPETATVTLGTTYPSRLFFSNPAPSSGSLTSAELGVELQHATALDPDVAEYLASVDGTIRVDSSALVYEPHYNEYRDAPATVYEPGVVFTRDGSGETTLVADEGFISGNRLTLVGVDADIAAEGVDAAQFSVGPVSAPARELTVINTVGERLTLTVQTTLDEARWDDILASELVSNGGNVADYTFESGESVNTLTVTLADGKFYNLRLARVQVGDSDTPAAAGEPAYIVKQAGGDRFVPAGSTEQLVVQVLDAYNNPVEGVIVRGTYPTGELTPNNWPTDEDGTATFSYKPGDIDQTIAITFWFGEDETDPVKSTTFSLVVGDTASAAAGDLLDQGRDSGVFLASVDAPVDGTATVRFTPAAGEETKRVVAASFDAFYTDREGDEPTGLVVGDAGNPTLALGDASSDLATPVTVDGETAVSFRFEGTVESGDSALVTLTFDDGTTSTYLVQLSDWV